MPFFGRRRSRRAQLKETTGRLGRDSQPCGKLSGHVHPLAPDVPIALFPLSFVLHSFDTSRATTTAQRISSSTCSLERRRWPPLCRSLLLLPIPRLRVGCLPVEEQLPLGPGGVRALAARLASAGPATGVLESERVKGAAGCDFARARSLARHPLLAAREGPAATEQP